MPQKILFVDDDPLMHMLYRPHIERAGYQVLAAHDGLEAVETAARELPQLIIMDIIMPNADGLTALRELKKAEATKSIPVIITTANVGAYAAARQEAETSGASGFLSKPLSPAKLIEEIRRVLPA
jgi:CheY-like chemotaxis protein